MNGITIIKEVWVTGVKI